MKIPPIKILPTGNFFSPKELFTRAIIISIVFLCVHLLGLRKYTSILCGMNASETLSRSISAVFGVLYMILYLLTVVLIPVLLFSACCLYITDRWYHKKH
ncbi:MAG: hypothetical protein ABIH42_03815 [Planctomycetota bacterium]